jgi:hypothetical protein
VFVVHEVMVSLREASDSETVQVRLKILKMAVHLGADLQGRIEG